MATNPSEQTPTNEYLSGRQLALARLAWVLFALVLTLIRAAGQVAAFREAQQLQLPPEAIAGLTQLGLNVQQYGIFNFFYQLLIPLAWSGLALLIFWQKSNERSALIS